MIFGHRGREGSKRFSCLVSHIVFFLLCAGSQRLSHMLRQPYDLYKAGWCDQYIMGLTNQVAQSMDPAITQEVRSAFLQLTLQLLPLVMPPPHTHSSYSLTYSSFTLLVLVYEW